MKKKVNHLKVFLEMLGDLCENVFLPLLIFTGAIISLGNEDRLLAFLLLISGIVKVYRESKRSMIRK